MKFIVLQIEGTVTARGDGGTILPLREGDAIAPGTDLQPAPGARILLRDEAGHTFWVSVPGPLHLPMEPAGEEEGRIEPEPAASKPEPEEVSHGYYQVNRIQEVVSPLDFNLTQSRQLTHETNHPLQSRGTYDPRIQERPAPLSFRLDGAESEVFVWRGGGGREAGGETRGPWWMIAPIDRPLEDGNALPTLSIADNNGSAPGHETVPEDGVRTGRFGLVAEDGLDRIEVGGVVVTRAQLLDLAANPVSIVTPRGELVLTGYDPAAGEVSWRYTPTAQDHTGGDPVDAIAIEVVDVDGDTASGTLEILITDTVPQAVDDAVGGLQEDGVQTVAFGALANDHLNVDVPVPVTGVAPGVTGSAAGNVGVPVMGTYGWLTLDADGSASYQLDNGSAAVQGLRGGETVTDVFTYTLTDADGDASTAQIRVTITGANDAPVLTPNSAVDYEEDGAPRSILEPAFSLSDPDATDHISAAEVIFTNYLPLEDRIQVGALPAGITAVVDTPAPGQYRIRLSGDATPADYEAALRAITYDNTSQQPTEGTRNFTLQVTDDQGAVSNVSNGVIHVDATPDPVANSLRVTEGDPAVDQTYDDGDPATVEGNLLANDDGGTPSAVISGFTYEDESGTLQTGTLGASVDTRYGTFTLNADGSWRYQPDPYEDQSTLVRDTITYQVTDGNGDLATTTFTIEVLDRPMSVSPTSATVEEADLQGTTGPVTPDTASGTLNLTTNDPLADVVFTGINDGDDSGLTQNGRTIYYYLDAAAHRLTASTATTEGAVNAGNTVFTVDLTGTSGAGANPGYQATLYQPLDHPLGGGGNSVTRTFGFRADDQDSSVTGTFDVTIVDDVPAAGPLSLTTPEDTAIDFHLSEGSGSLTIDGASVAPGDTVRVNEGGNPVGSLQYHGGGDFTFTPDPHFSGTPSFSYSVVDVDGDSASGTVFITVSPVSDAPVVTVDAAQVTTHEDTDVALGLNAPSVTDATDRTPSAGADHPERLGAITLSGFRPGSQLLDAAGAVLFTATAADTDVTIQLSDGAAHVAGLTTELTLTVSEYESLRYRPAPDEHQNAPLQVTVTEHEVDATGVPLAGVAGATNTTTLAVEVLAVTDRVDLKLAGADHPVAAPYSATIAEDTTLDLAALLSAAYDDTDGSEQRAVVIANPAGNGTIVVNGTAVAGGDSLTIPAPGLSGGTTFPAITLGAPANVSGSFNGIEVRLEGRDSDADSPSASPALEQDAAYLDLTVTPVAGDVAGTNASTAEDTALALSALVQLTDTDGSETLTGLTIKALATGWKVLDGAGNLVFTGDGSTDYAVPGADLNYRLLPPAHSSVDATVTFEATTTDGSNTVVTTLTPRVQVTPVAEVTTPNSGGNTDSDGDGVPDLTMNGDFTYSTAGREDQWFALDTDGFDFKGPWSNQDGDGSEATFALLTPVLSGGSANGAQFRYTDGTGTHVLTYVGTPVEIPVAHLDTVEFKAADNVSGSFEIQVQARTRDTDPDDGRVHVADSGSATLTNLVIEPVADPVTLSVVSPVKMDEDTAHRLEIRPTSADKDGSETFTVTITGIPTGAQLVYDGTLLTPSGGQVTIPLFDSTKPLTIQPPAQSNDDFTLQVSAVAVDGTDTGPVSQTLSIEVQVAGVADAPVVTTATATHTEADLDTGADQITLDGIITGLANPDTDGSQSQVVLVTGLDGAFDLSGAGVSLLGGSGTSRVWSVDGTALSTAVIRTPANYSGTFTFDARVVVTENDGHSTEQDLPGLTVQVHPSAEAGMNLATTADEDRLQQVDFSIVHNNGDTDETLTSVWISEADLNAADFTLYLGNGTGLPLLSANGQPGVTIDAGWVKLTGGAIDDIYVLGDADHSGNGSFTVRYTIQDSPQDGTLAADTAQSGDVTYGLVFNPVTDPVDAALGTLTLNNGNGTVSGATVQVTGNTEVTVPITFTQQDDATEGPNGADLDGSEKLLRLEIAGVPEGVTVQGGTYIGDAPDGSNSGRWLVDLADPAFDSASGIIQSLVFLVDGSAAQLAGLTASITVTGVSRDGATGSERRTPATWTLQVDNNFDDSGQNLTPPPGIDQAQQKPSVAADEDQPLTLSDLLDLQISGSGNFSIRLENLPPGTRITGMEEVSPGIWSASGNGDNNALQTLLAGIQVTPPDDFNDNHGGPLTFDATLTTYSSSGNRNDANVTVVQPITPVSDAIELSLATPDGTEDTPVTLTVNLSNGADGSQGTVVGGSLYLQLDESGVTGAAGTLEHNGATLTLQSVSGVPGVPDGNYYVVTGVTLSAPVSLVYHPGAHASGDVVLKSWVVGQENGAANTVTSQADSGFTIQPVLDGVSLSVPTASGDEDSPIQVHPALAPLADGDGSERLISAVLENLPVGHVVYVGADAASAVLATNLGDNGSGANDWSLPLNSGQLPAYIAILPPPDWSGTVAGIRLALHLAETNGASQKYDAAFDLVVTPVADAATLNPTLSFGTEGDRVPLNLNASLQDVDGSETAVVTLQGLGAHAAFFGDGGSLLSATYDAANDTYTLSGLSHLDVNNLSVIQSARTGTVNVTLYTEDGASRSATASGSFQLEIDPALATTGDDTLLYSGSPLDGLAGVDTVVLRLGEDLDFSTPQPAADLDNIEVLDLGVGDHSLSGLSLQDVIDITDSGNDLKILGESGDSVTFLNDVAGESWTKGGTVVEDGRTFDLYTHSADPSVLVKVETGISDTIV